MNYEKRFRDCDHAEEHHGYNIDYVNCNLCGGVKPDNIPYWEEAADAWWPSLNVAVHVQKYGRTYKFEHAFSGKEG